jgi:hypothetical protein
MRNTSPGPVANLPIYPFRLQTLKTLRLQGYVSVEKSGMVAIPRILRNAQEKRLSV